MNLMQNGFFSAQRLSELKIYYKVLPDDCVAPKMAIGEAIEYMEEEQRRIAMIEQQAQLMRQRAQQFLMEDPDGQADQIADAQRSLMNQQEAEQYELVDEEVDESIQ